MRNKRQRCLYLGPAEDDKVIELIQRIQEKKKSAQEAKKRAAFFIKLLKGAGVIPVSGLAEKVLRLLSEEELIFGNGMLIGTFAFLAYQTKLGFSAWGKAARTADVDLLRTEIFVLVNQDLPSLSQSLGSLGEEFFPEGPLTTGIPLRLRHPAGLTIEVLATPKAGPPKIVSPPQSGFRDIGAQELARLNFLVEAPFSGFLVGERSLIPVTIPAPERFAVHKLLVAGLRLEKDLLKALKDIEQAAILIEVLSARGLKHLLKERFLEMYQNKKSAKFLEKALKILAEKHPDTRALLTE